MKVGQIITISDYTFERISEKEYNVTTPNGEKVLLVCGKLNETIKE